MVGRDPLKRSGLAGAVVRLPSAPPIVVRERGDRDLQEIPPDEVAALSRLLAMRSGIQPGEALKRGVLEFYARARLTEAASTFLDRCFGLFGEGAVRDEADRLAVTMREADTHQAPIALPTAVLTALSERPEQSGSVAQIGPGAPVGPVESDTPAPEGAAHDGDVWEGPPFWEIVSGVARTAGTFTGPQQQALADLWRYVDGSDELEHLRSEAASLGAESEWSEVAKFMRANLTQPSAEFRGAATDVAYIRYWRDSVAAGPLPPKLPDAPRRLLEAFDAAEREVKRMRSSDSVAGGACIHGAIRGRCLYIACQNHPSGGMDTTRD